MSEQNNQRLVEVVLDDKSIGRATPDIEHERAVAIFDLIEDNVFGPVGDEIGGPYKLVISIVDARLVFDISHENGNQIAVHILSLTPLKKIIKDYFLICESYYEAIRTASPTQIEAIDMGRRGLHNEGTDILKERLSGKIDFDYPTARRLFTLICVLHWRG